jgi:hypothetical protein
MWIWWISNKGWLGVENGGGPTFGLGPGLFNARFPFVLSPEPVEGSKQERKPRGLGRFIPFDVAQDRLRQAQGERPQPEH